MENNIVLSKNIVLTLILSFAQIIGLVVAVTVNTPVGAVISGIAGFAAVVKYFTPSPSNVEWIKKLNTVSAICGVGLIIFAIISVSN